MHPVIESRDISEHVAKTTADGLDIFIFDDGSVLIVGEKSEDYHSASHALALWACGADRVNAREWLEKHRGFTGTAAEIVERTSAHRLWERSTGKERHPQKWGCRFLL